MKRRSFLQHSIVGAAGISLSSFTGSTVRKRKWEGSTLINAGRHTALIQCRYINTATKVLQITDAHISLDDPADASFVQYGQRMHSAYANTKYYQNESPTVPSVEFVRLMNLAKDSNVDLIALTGDIVNFPSKRSVDFVLSELHKTGIPYFYIAGNHDWHYEGMSGSDNALRQFGTEGALKPLYNGDHPLFFKRELKGVLHLAFDNSTYEFNEAQLLFLKQQLKRELPTILYVHIPIYMPSLGPASAGHPAWGAGVDRNYEIEKRERWPVQGCSKETREFISEVMKAGNIMSVFCGHYHEHRQLNFSGSNQFITEAALSGAYRMITLEPLTIKQ